MPSLPKLALPAFVHRHFMRRALQTATNSPDPSRKVGMVMVRMGLFEVAKGCNDVDVETLRQKINAPMPALQQFLDEHPDAISAVQQHDITAQQLVKRYPDLLATPLKYDVVTHAEVNTILSISRVSAKVQKWFSALPLPSLNFANRSKGYLNWVTCNPCGGVLTSNKVRHLICLEPENWVEARYGSFYENVDRLVAAGIRVDFIGRRLDAKEVELYPRLISYEEIKKRDGYTPLSQSKVGPTVG